MRLSRSSTLALVAALAAGCADAPQPTALVPATPTAPTPAELVGGFPAGALSRTHPVGRWLSRGPTATPSTLVGGSAPAFGALRLPDDERPAALTSGTELVLQGPDGQVSTWWSSGGTWPNDLNPLPTVPAAWRVVAAADFNADGKPDLVWQNLSTGDRSIWLMNGLSWSGNAALLPNVSPAWSIVGAGDFNADGKPDLVWQNTTTGDRSIWFMNGATWPGSYAALPNVPVQWRIAAVEDFTGDNGPDLVWQNTSTGHISIWLMSGSTWNGTYAALPTTVVEWSIVAAADFNADGQADILWENATTGGRVFWVMTGTTWGGSYTLLPARFVTAHVVAAGTFANRSVAPSAPTAVAPTTQVSTSPTELTLTWTRSASGNDTRTRVERAPWGTTTYTQLGSSDGTAAYLSGLTPATRYLFRVQACNAAGCSAYASSSIAETGPATTTDIGSGTQTNQSAAIGTSRWYRLTLAAGASATITTSGGTGNADLTVWHGASIRDCLSEGGTNAETCTFSATGAPTTYYVQLFANTAYGGVSLTVAP